MIFMAMYMIVSGRMVRELDLVLQPFLMAQSILASGRSERGVELAF